MWRVGVWSFPKALRLGGGRVFKTHGPLKFILNPITFINHMINDIGFKPTINMINL